MKKICFFDLITLAAALCVCFAIGFHIGRDEEAAVPVCVEVTLKLYKSKIPDSISDTELKIDGKYDCELLSLDGEAMSIALYGSYQDAGFLISGAKYLSENQPLEIIGKNTYFYGRILHIDHASVIEEKGFGFKQSEFLCIFKQFQLL